MTSLLNAEDVVAVDMHVHLRDEVSFAIRKESFERLGRHFSQEVKVVPVDDLADQYRSRRMMAAIMNSTDVVRTGNPAVPNDHIADIVRSYPDVFLGFGAVDPHAGRPAAEEVERCHELGLHGIGELNPSRQGFVATQSECEPVWATAQRLRMPVVFHTGYSGMGSSAPGGGGLKLEYNRPIPYLDSIAADFPELTIIGAHPGWPFEAENLAVARHKSNYFIDLSGWAPKYFSNEVVAYASSVIPHKFLFGSDWPNLPVERWLAEFEQLPIKETSRPRILRDNAFRVMELAG